MEDTNVEPVGERAETAIKLLDFAFHENTGDDEALNAIRAYRRVSKGMLPSILLENQYGDGGEALNEDQWQEIFSQQELTINALRGEVRRLKKALDESRRRQQRRSGEGTTKQSRVEQIPPELSIPDTQWEAISHLVPAKYRDENGRARVSAMIVILRSGCGWRVLGTPEKPDGWTTYYNQYNQKWKREAWWSEMMEILKGFENAE